MAAKPPKFSTEVFCRICWVMALFEAFLCGYTIAAHDWLRLSVFAVLLVFFLAMREKCK